MAAATIRLRRCCWPGTPLIYDIYSPRFTNCIQKKEENPNRGKSKSKSKRGCASFVWIWNKTHCRQTHIRGGRQGGRCRGRRQREQKEVGKAGGGRAGRAGSSSSATLLQSAGNIYEISHVKCQRRQATCHKWTATQCDSAPSSTLPSPACTPSRDMCQIWCVCVCRTHVCKAFKKYFLVIW